MPDHTDPLDNPATLRDLAAAGQRTADAIADARRETVEAIADAKRETVEALTEVMRDMQTELLTGLASFARGNFARFHSIESNQTDVNIRLAALEERVMNLETRPPHRQPPQ